MSKTRFLFSSAIAGAQLLMASAGMAQTATPAEETGGQIEDIVVTARRTEESLQRTPVAVTALNAAALTTAKVENVLDLQRTAPGLTIARGSAGGDGIVFVSIRGQGNLQPILSNDPAVATYIDGVYVARPSTGLTDIQDIQRIEVLRGPQGTLFGRNTTGGAINIISNDPNQTMSARIKGEYGNFNTTGLQGTINVPLTDKLAVRVNGTYLERDGYGKTLNTRRDLADTKNYFVRGKVKYEDDGFDITLSGDYNKTSNSGQMVALQAINTAAIPVPSFIPLLQAGLHTRNNWWANTATGTSTPAASATLPADVRALYGRAPFNTLEVYGFTGTLNVELGDLNLKSISSYRHSKNFGLSDTDATAAPLLATFAASSSRYISQEVQISGNITDAWSFIAGAYYGHEKGFEISRSQIFGGLIRNSIADAVNKTTGVFAQTYYEISDTLRAVGGFRYTWDTRNTVLHNQQVLGLPANAPVATPTGINCTVTPTDPVTATNCNQAQNAKFDYPAWTLGLDWQATEQLFVYLKTSGAAKAGGWNLRAGGLPAFAPEKVRDVELGLKADLFDRRVRFNSAIFGMEKKSNQAIVNAFVPGIGVTQYIQNNGTVRIWGLESELTVVPWEGMTLSANGSLQDGKYKKGSFSEVQIVAGSGCTAQAGVANSCLVDLSDLPLIQLPKKQINLSATQKYPVGPGTLSVTGNWAYIGSQHFNTVKAATQHSAAVKAQYATENALGKVGGYGLFNGRIAYQFDEPNLEVAVYGRNITNKKYVVRRFSDLYRTLGIADEYVGYPGTYGVEVTFNF